MRTKIVLILALLCASFSSCKKDDKAKFDYPLETLYGTWKGTEVQSGGIWVDITKAPNTDLGFSITFNSDGSYSGSGYFGNGTGTYKATGKTVDTYVEGEFFAKYTIITMTAAQVEATMTMGKESINIRAKKQ